MGASIIVLSVYLRYISDEIHIDSLNGYFVVIIIGVTLSGHKKDKHLMCRFK